MGTHRIKTVAYWYRIGKGTSGEFIPVSNHAADALADPSWYGLTRTEVAIAMKAGITFMQVRPAILKLVIGHGFIRVRLTVAGLLVVQAQLPENTATTLLVIDKVAGRLGLHGRTRVVVYDDDGVVRYRGRINRAMTMLSTETATLPPTYNGIPVIPVAGHPGVFVTAGAASAVDEIGAEAFAIFLVWARVPTSKPVSRSESDRADGSVIHLSYVRTGLDDGTAALVVVLPAEVRL